MAVSSSYKAFVLEQLQLVPSVTAKRMFGGLGIYSEGFFFALVDDDRLYLKVDDSNRPDFEAASMGPFRPYGDERVIQYYEVPVDVLEAPDLLKEWAEKAIAVAREAKRKKSRP